MKRIFPALLAILVIFSFAGMVSATTPPNSIEFVDQLINGQMVKDYDFGQGDNPNGADVKIVGDLDHILVTPEFVDQYSQPQNLFYTDKGNGIINIPDHVNVIDDNIPLGQSTLTFVFKDGTEITQVVYGLPHHDASMMKDEDSAPATPSQPESTPSQTEATSSTSVQNPHTGDNFNPVSTIIIVVACGVLLLVCGLRLRSISKSKR